MKESKHFGHSSHPVNMAKGNKGKGSSSSGANNIPLGKGVGGGAAAKNPTPAAESLPQLEESAFAGLRQKIEQRLKDQNNAKQKSKNGKGKSAPADTPKKNQPVASKPQPKQTSADDKNNKGKKRDRNGDVIAGEATKDIGKGKPKSKEDGDDVLRQEILALGGTEEDLDLLAGVDSESEVEDATEKKSKGKSEDDFLRKELASMLAAAGQVVPDDLEDDEVEGEDEEEEEEEDEDEDEETGGIEVDAEDDEEDVEEDEEDASEDEPPTPAPKEDKKAVKQAAPENIFPKEFSKLVSQLIHVSG